MGSGGCVNPHLVYWVGKLHSSSIQSDKFRKLEEKPEKAKRKKDICG